MKKFQLKKDNQIFSRFEFKYIINKNLSSYSTRSKNFTTNDDFTKKKKIFSSIIIF